MCSGRLDPGFVLRAFEKGSDGVLILGCHPGDCQYVEGNLKTEKRVQMISRLLEAIGFDNERLKLKWVSASEATRFADIVKGFVDDLKSKGPHMIKKEA
jgi:F420-non-reducing hydrogenase iron-sulfur subunit